MHHQYHVMEANVSSIHESNKSQIHRDIYKCVAFEIATSENGNSFQFVIESEFRKFESTNTGIYYVYIVDTYYLRDAPPHYYEDSLNRLQFRCSPGNR